MFWRRCHSFLNIPQITRTPIGYSNNRRVYTHIHLLMKAQRSILTNLQSKIQAMQERFSGTSLEILTSLSEQLKSLLRAFLGRLPDTAHNVVIQLHNHMQNELDPEVKQLVIRALKATLSLRSLLASLQVQNEEPRVQQSEEETPEWVETDQGEEMICRICDERISVDLFEDHVESCLTAHQSEPRVAAIDGKLQELAAEMCTRFLSVPWPGHGDVCERVYLPLVHARMWVERALDVDMSYCDAADDLELISSGLSALSRLEMPAAASEMIRKIAKKVQEKKHVARAFSEAMGVWVRTTKTGTLKRGIAPPMISDFELLSRISSGAFARVFVAKKKATGDIFAIKVLPKEDVVRKNQVKRVLAEKDILLQFNSPYVIKFYYSIIGERNLYLVMEFVPGGDLYSLLHHMGSLDEQTAKVYTFQICKALEHLHSHGIIHRDLKPDNILVNATGTLKLTDFGLSYLGVVDRRNVNSKENLVESNSLVGTPDYMAPEIVLNLPHSFPVDWWAVGIMVYEFIRGTPPFHQDTVLNTRRQIITGKYDPLTPEEDDVTPECIDFISKLLVDDPKKRLGANGSQEVLSHPWLASIRDIKDLPMPFVPELADRCDTAYFEERYRPSIRDDADIIGDINAADEKRKREGRRIGGKRMRSVSLFSSEDLSDVSATSDERNPDSDIMSFPSVSLKQLEHKSRKIARRVRERAKSFIVDEPEKPVGRRKSYIPMQSRKSVDLAGRRTIPVVLSDPICLLQPSTATDDDKEKAEF